MDSSNNGDNRKRKQSGLDLQLSTDFHLQHNDAENNDFLKLSLAKAYNTAPPQPPRRSPSPAGAPVRRRRARRNPSKTPPAGKSATIPPPYPWSGSGRATVRSLSYLRANRIGAISGDVQCRKCEQKFAMEFDLEQKFGEISAFIAENKNLMRQRAPNLWLNPALPRCNFCNHEGSVKPVIAEKKRSINWLFLLLGQMLGCCTLEQLKYFCKHTKNHRTGAKDRVLFLAYLALCRQLDPTGPWDI